MRGSYPRTHSHSSLPFTHTHTHTRAASSSPSTHPLMGQSCWKAKEEATDSDRATQGHGAYAADSDAPALAHTEGEWDTLPHHDPIHGGDGILGVCTFPGLPSFVLTGGEDGKIVVTNWTTGATHQSVAAHKHDIRHFYYNTPQRLLLSCSRDKLVKAWRVGEDARINHLHTLAGHSFVVANVCSNDDGSRIVSGSRDNTVRMWDSETGAQVKCKETPRNLVHCLRWVHNHTVVQGGENLKLYLWDMRDDNIVLMGQPIEGIKDQPVCMSVSPTDNNYVLVGYKGFTDETAAVRLWDIRTRKPVHVFKGHRMCVTDVGYLPTRLTDKPLIVS
eukprot:Sspe_Gene.4552::Locus_1491_Transcript_1_1_Confidence_1.000_Length_1225::g.4552::m.4552